MPSAVVGGTASQPLGTSAVPCNLGVQFRADPGNSGTIVISYSSGVTVPVNGDGAATDGVPLRAGDSYFVPYQKILPPGNNTPGGAGPDASRIWAIASASGQTLEWDVL